MRKYILLASGCLIISCNSRHSATNQKNLVTVPEMDTGSINTVKNFTTEESAGFTELDNYMKKFQRPVQSFSVRGDTSSLVIGAKGTRIAVIPSDLECLDGSKPSDRIVVELIELHTREDFLRNAMPTTSNGKLLESGGAYYISMSSAGKRLRIKNGHQMLVTFPRKSQKNMTLYNGVKTGNGDINWVSTEKAFIKKNAEDSVLVRTEIPTYRDTILEKLEMRPNASQRKMAIEKFRRYAPIEVRIIDDKYCFTGRVRYTTNQWYTEKKKSGTDMLIDDFYQAMNLSGFGWFNCDMPVSVETLALQSELSGENTRAIEVFIVYKDMNTVDRKRLIVANDNPFVLSGLAKNQTVKIVALSWRDNAAFADIQTLKTAGEASVKLDMKRVSYDELDRLLAL